MNPDLGRPGDESWGRLAQAIVARRVALGFPSREAFGRASLISSRLLGDLENTRRKSYDRSTIARLEQSLRWTSGSVDSVLRGGEPDPIRTAPVERAVSPNATTGTAVSPTLHFAGAVRIGRLARRWTQPQLAERCQAAGLDWDRSIIANVEAGRRKSVTVEEWLTLAAVLDIPPVHALLPAGSDLVEVTPGIVMEAAEAARWIRREVCRSCAGAPPAGFSCNQCGLVSP